MFFPIVVLMAGMACRGGVPEAARQSSPAQPLPAKGLFDDNPVHSIQIEIEPQAVVSLHDNPREYVRAVVRHEGRIFLNVGIHLKGSAGSFREIDNKPALTLQFDHFQRFYGLRKIHLNNSVEDPGYIHELLGSELFRAAGVPAPRVTHALVELNGRKLGLYVLKEGFTEDFLSGHFRRPDGILFEPGQGQDVNGRMKRQSGSRSTGEALNNLAACLLEADDSRRWQRLVPVLDTDRFVSFMVLEIMLCHKDGYSLAGNNYRVYCDPETGRTVFLPQGMDQLFGISDLPWKPNLSGRIATAVMNTPEGRRAYEARFRDLLTNLFQVEPLSRRVDQIHSQLRPFLPPADFRAIEREGVLMKERMARRFANLREQLDQPEPAAMDFQSGMKLLTGWVKRDAPAHGRMEPALTAENIPVLEIAANANTTASWRTKALLKRGQYRFACLAKVEAVRPLPFGRRQGAGIRLSNHDSPAKGLIGDSSWQPLSIDFDVVAETEEVELICELRASAGKAYFDTRSLRLKALPDRSEYPFR